MVSVSQVQHAGSMQFLKHIMSWKDTHREHKQATGLSWAEYHERWFVHRDELDDLHTQIERLTEQLEATQNTYQKMHREVFESRIMEEYDE